jgi:hypothetical protein
MPALPASSKPKASNAEDAANHRVPGLPVVHQDARLDSARGAPTSGLPDGHMNTPRGHPYSDDVRMDTARMTLKPGGFRMWEKDLLESPEVRRKATVAQLCETAPSYRSPLALKPSQTFWTTTFSSLVTSALVKSDGLSSMLIRRPARCPPPSTRKSSSRTAAASAFCSASDARS